MASSTAASAISAHSVRLGSTQPKTMVGAAASMTTAAVIKPTAPGSTQAGMNRVIRSRAETRNAPSRA